MLRYYVGANTTGATVNDMIVGGLVILAATGAVLTYRRRSRQRGRGEA